MVDILLISGVVVLLIYLSGFLYLASMVTAWQRRRAVCGASKARLR